MGDLFDTTKSTWSSWLTAGNSYTWPEQSLGIWHERIRDVRHSNPLGEGGVLRADLQRWPYSRCSVARFQPDAQRHELLERSPLQELRCSRACHANRQPGPCEWLGRQCRLLVQNGLRHVRRTLEVTLPPIGARAVPPTAVQLLAVSVHCSCMLYVLL